MNAIPLVIKKKKPITILTLYFILISYLPVGLSQSHKIQILPET